MNYLKTYRNYLLINKLLDLIIYLVILTIVTTFSFMVYYTTKSFFILLIIMALIYIVGLFIAKLFQIKILLPSIIYLLVSTFLIAIICRYEQGTINSDLIEYLFIGLTILSLITIVIALYKYETPISIYYKAKDYFSGISQSKKIKTKFLNNKNHNTITPYSTNLSFEKNKLLNKLNEEFKDEQTRLDNQYIKQNEKLKNETDKLNDLETQFNKVCERLKQKNTGAQNYELCNQRKALREKISKQKEITAQFIAEVNTLKNIKIELKNTYEKNHYNISNGYNMRYVNYTNTIKERLTLTEYNLDIVPFEEVEKNLEG